MVRRIDDMDTEATRGVAERPHQVKRGKIIPAAVGATWDQKDGMGRDWDPEAGKKLLDESLGS